jgi:ribose transport system ATP-binding protein
MTAAALELRGVSKSFGGQPALSDVSLTLERGQIHALLGQNGSGKSTLIKVLAGYHKPEPGAVGSLYGVSLALDGHPSGSSAPIRFVHQDRGLVGALNAVDNLALTTGYEGRWWLRSSREARRARHFLEDYGVTIDVDARVDTLSVANQTMLAILRAVKEQDRPIVLVIDEATASLTSEDVSLLFRLLRDIRDRGGSVLYVTHRLGEVLTLADQVTVLRDGHNVATRSVESLTHEDLVHLIIGREVTAFQPSAVGVRDDPVLAVRELSAQGVNNVSLAVHPGEVVGVTGLVGSGFERLPALIFGSERRDGGSVRVQGGADIDPSPRASISAGLVFAPVDRQVSTMRDWSLAENITLPRLDTVGKLMPWWLSYRAERGDASTWLRRLEVVPSGPAVRLSALSGGNQQRVVLARWLRTGFKVMLLEDPTAGVDVGVKPAIYEAIAEAARAGAGVLISISDAEEAVEVCNRLIVMRDGAIAATLTREEFAIDRIIAIANAAPEHERTFVK